MSDFSFHCGQRLDQLINKERDADEFLKDTMLGQIETVEPLPAVSRKEPSKSICKQWCDASNECGGVSAMPDPEGSGGWVCYFFPPPPNNKYYDFHHKSGWWSYLRGGSGSLTACQQACNPASPDPLPTWCPAAIQKACSQNMLSSYCLNICARREINCDVPLQRYCDSLGIEKARGTDICGCFLPSSFYENYYSNLSSKVTLPANMQIFCTYPACASSLMPRYGVKTGQLSCPNISQCIQYIDIDNSGTITGDISVNPSSECSQQGIRLRDPNDSPSPSASSSTLLWVGLGVAGVALGVGLLVFFLRKKR